jgi:hypothetical protein
MTICTLIYYVLASFKEMSCSSWIKKAGTSDSATNAEKRFKYEKEKRTDSLNGFSMQNGAKVVPGLNMTVMKMS